MYSLEITKREIIILPEQGDTQSDISPDFADKKIAIFIHLYYDDTIAYYVDYIKNIPSGIDIYISYSSNSTKDKIQKELEERGIANYQLVFKNNRGRDISALLVAFREIILGYDYICFLHDKGSKSQFKQTMTREWIYDLWENTLSSESYIRRIISIFDKKDDMGLLIPPYLASHRSGMAVINMWSDNYNNACKLAEKLKLSCTLDSNESPMAQGTCFWAKTQALKKIFDIEWKYEDFPDEPMPSDGTISHAIERIFPFIAQDAGYMSGWLMTEDYAGDYIKYLIQNLSAGAQILKDECGLPNIESFYYWKEDLINLDVFTKQYRRFFVYGTGQISLSIQAMLKKLNVTPTSYIVTKKLEGESVIDGIPVVEAAEADIQESDGIIIAVGIKNLDAVISNIDKLWGDRKRTFVLKQYDRA